MSRWGIDGPPEDAYGRVTNSERFATLHEVALQLIADLHRVYDIDLTEGYGVDPELESAFELARATLVLTPRDPNCAPISVAFSAFPGIYVRFGRWLKQPFPSCGCDACDEDTDEEAARFKEVVDDVVAGRFRESLKALQNEPAIVTFELWSDAGSSTGGSQLDRDQALKIVRDGLSSWEWGAWPRRAGET